MTEAEKAEREAAAANRPSKLALGTEGGFALEHQKDYTLDKTASLVVLQGAGQPRLEVPLPCPDLPELVLNVVTAIQVSTERGPMPGPVCIGCCQLGFVAVLRAAGFDGLYRRNIYGIYVRRAQPAGL